MASQRCRPPLNERPESRAIDSIEHVAAEEHRRNKCRSAREINFVERMHEEKKLELQCCCSARAVGNCFGLTKSGEGLGKGGVWLVRGRVVTACVQRAGAWQALSLAGDWPIGGICPDRGGDPGVQQREWPAWAAMTIEARNRANRQIAGGWQALESPSHTSDAPVGSSRMSRDLARVPQQSGVRELALSFYSTLCGALPCNASAARRTRTPETRPILLLKLCREETTFAAGLESGRTTCVHGGGCRTLGSTRLIMEDLNRFPMQGAMYVVSDSCPSSACTGLIRCVSWLKLDGERLPAHIHVFFMENSVSEHCLDAIRSTPFQVLQSYSTLTRHAFAISQSTALHLIVEFCSFSQFTRVSALNLHHNSISRYWDL